MNRLRSLWVDLRTSLWFVPGLIVFGMMALAVGLIEVDTRVPTGYWSGYPRLFGAGADGARSMLSSIAGSVITVAGVAFSITIVALSLASTQYTSRLLRKFMGDRTNQVVLGVLVGVFAYCLVVLRTIRGGDGEFVPALALLVAVVLAIGSMGFLVYFIHHIANSIQAAQILGAVADDTIGAIHALFPEELGQGEPDDEPGPGSLVEYVRWTPIPAAATGYLVRVDAETLLGFARKHDTVVRMHHGIGEFVIRQRPLVSLAGRLPADATVVKAINGCFVIGRQRSIEQDAGFGIRQIVDMAVKALSPGINDPTTAIMAINHLTSILVALAGRRTPSRYRWDGDELRVIARGPGFPELLDEAHSEIRRESRGNVVVLERLRWSLDTIREVTESPGRIAALDQQEDWLQETIRREVQHREGRDRLGG